jgi:hypothetical protein
MQCTDEDLDRRVEELCHDAEDSGRAALCSLLLLAQHVRRSLPRPCWKALTNTGWMIVQTTETAARALLSRGIGL